MDVELSSSSLILLAEFRLCRLGKWWYGLRIVQLLPLKESLILRDHLNKLTVQSCFFVRLFWGQQCLPVGVVEGSSIHRGSRREKGQI